MDESERREFIQGEIARDRKIRDAMSVALVRLARDGEFVEMKGELEIASEMRNNIVRIDRRIEAYERSIVAG